MANILKSFFSQCARPKGALGRVMLSFMNVTVCAACQHSAQQHCD